MAATKFDICSNALMFVGAGVITDFSGSTAESAAAKQYWQTTVDNWLTLYDWQFATTTAQLSRLGSAPLDEWDAAYSQPAGAIKIQAVRVNDDPISYDRYQDKIHCNAAVSDTVYCDYTFSVDCAFWPPYFVELIEVALAKKFGTAIAGKLDLKSTFEGDIESQFRLAKNADARQQTAKRVNLSGRGSILAARRA